jgi:hypothetical protein
MVAVRRPNRRGSRGLVSLLGIGCLAFLLQVCRHGPASVTLDGRKANVTRSQKTGLAAVTEHLAQSPLGEKLRSNSAILTSRLKDLQFPELETSELNTKVVPVLRGLRARLANHSDNIGQKLASMNAALDTEAVATVASDVRRQMMQRDWAAARATLADGAADLRRSLSARSSAARESIIAGDTVHQLRGWARHAAAEGFDNLQVVVKRAAADAQKYGVPLLASASRQISRAATKAGQQIGHFADRLQPTVDKTSEQNQPTATDLGLQINADISMELSELGPASQEMWRRLEAASDQIRFALVQISSDPRSFAESAAAEAIERIKVIAADTGDQIQLIIADTAVPRQQLRNLSAAGLRVLRQHLTTDAAAKAAKRMQAAVRDIKPILANFSNVPVVAETFQLIQAISGNAGRQVLALARRVGEAGIVGDAHQGVSAVAAMAHQYIETVVDEALDSIGLETEQTRSPPADEPASSSRRAPWTMLLVAIVIGSGAAFAVRSRRAAESRRKDQLPSRDQVASRETTPERTPTKEPRFTASPKVQDLGAS